MEILPLNGSPGFLELPWEDVVNTQILPRLSWQDLFHLRQVSHEFRRLINGYFSKCHRVDLSSGCTRITALAFQVITCSNTLLTTLILSNCKWLTDSLLIPVYETNPCLVYVDISGCQSISATSLQILATSDTQFPCSLSKKYAASAISACMLQYCGKLAFFWLLNLIALLCMRNPTSQFQSTQITKTDLTLKTPFELSRAFVRINATWSFTNYRCRQLQKLILKNCYWQTSAALTVIAFHCPQLYFIDLTSCWQVNDEAVCTLVERCPRLTHISLAKIYGITNSSLFAISYHCPNLTHLDLVGCWRISDDGVRMVGEYCKDLKTLMVCECRDVSEVSLEALRSRVSIDLPSVPYPYNRAVFLKELGLNVQI